MITHRCKGSLEAEISIRYTYEFDILRRDSDYKTWRIFKYFYNYDYNCVNQYSVAKVTFCPFCGKKLKVVRLKPSVKI